MDQEHRCATCGQPAKGYVCGNCGQEMEECDAAHSCGVEHCQHKCAGCNKAESECAC